jgi:hypothetical protein
LLGLRRDGRDLIDFWVPDIGEVELVYQTRARAAVGCLAAPVAAG